MHPLQLLVSTSIVSVLGLLFYPKPHLWGFFLFCVQDGHCPPYLLTVTASTVLGDACDSPEKAVTGFLVLFMVAAIVCLPCVLG